MLGSHAVVPGSNPVLTFVQDLLPVVPYLTLPRLTNNQLGFLIMFSVKLKLGVCL